MNDMVTRDEMEALERTLHRVFARVSVLEARVGELERDLEAARGAAREYARPRLVEALARTA